MELCGRAFVSLHFSIQGLNSAPPSGPGSWQHMWEAAKGGPITWVSAIHAGGPVELLPPGFVTAQPWLSQAFGVNQRIE